MSEVSLKMKKLGQFFKQYGFYVAIGVICVGALTAVFLLPDNQGNVQNEANPYAPNEQVDGIAGLTTLPEEIYLEDEDELDLTDSITQDEVELSVPEATEVQENIVSDEVAVTEVKTETFESTTATMTDEPFFAEGDKFSWPVVGEVVVPYTDESTSHWFSESLNQTMRTFGICIAADANTEVKAVAKGTVTNIVDDSTSIFDSGVPFVGKTMVIDHGNGYVSYYGFQSGSANDNLLGQVVNAGDVIGYVGSPRGAFISAGDNIYLQVMHNDQVVNPLNFLENLEVSADLKADSVDMGFAAQ